MFDFQASLDSFLSGFLAFLNDLLNALFGGLASVFSIFTGGGAV
ncbi:MAG: hypothetical protein HBSAPP02_06230 [Phycisphaerae bacterium]|nr:MAG: hypothetical protein HBSAPP02_06230 [Phycisphaerae bacterium]